MITIDLTNPGSQVRVLHGSLTFNGFGQPISAISGGDQPAASSDRISRDSPRSSLFINSVADRPSSGFEK